MANPVFTLNAASYDTAGYVRVTFTNANKGANWYSWRIYRRLTGTTTYTLLKEYLNDTANYTFDDYSAPANVSSDYSVVRVHLVASVPTEEAHTPSSITPVGANYWLMDPITPANSLRLEIVIGDTFADEYDYAVHKLIGRGRKVDQGTNYGVSGSLEVQFRDAGTTARAQQDKLKVLKATQDYLWLRNPFGDVWKVVLGEISFTRLAGVGQNEYNDASFTYLQVA